MELSKAIRSRSLDEEVPKNTNVREHVLRIVYQELVRLVYATADVKLEPQVILMAGLQGSGKTTTTAKIARYFQKKGMKVGVICADTFRPGAYNQLCYALCEDQCALHRRPESHRCAEDCQRGPCCRKRPGELLSLIPRAATRWSPT